MGKLGVSNCILDKPGKLDAAERPYRGAVPIDKALAIMAETVGTAIDADCVDHLKKIIAQSPDLFPHRTHPYRL